MCANRPSQLPNHHPQPQIMIRKQEKSKPTESKHGGTKTKGKKAGKKGAWEVLMMTMKTKLTMNRTST